MKRSVSTLLVIMVVGAWFGVAVPTAAQSDGGAICALAQSKGSYGRYDVVLGTEGDDVLRGGSGNDLICGFGGNDRLVGGSGNDILVGGDGADDLRGGSGNDQLHFDDADTRVQGGSGNNQLVAAPAPGVVSIAFLPSVATAYCEVRVQYSGFAPFSTVDADLYARGPSLESTLLNVVDADLDGSGSATVDPRLDVLKGINEVRVLGPGIDSGWVLATC